MATTSDAPAPPGDAASPPPDYSTWPPARLIAHIHHLESQLPRTYPPSIPQPKKRPLRPFNPNAHPTRLIALRISYLGHPYNGFEYTPSATKLPTVEEPLFLALLKSRLVPALPTAPNPLHISAWPPESVTSYSKCGRTDRGVSAFGQVISLKVRSNRPADPEKLKTWDPVHDELNYPQILNRLLPATIRVLAWAPEVPEDFSARFSCLSRTYRYFFTNPMLCEQGGANPGALDTDAMNEAAANFLGSHDFRNFCKQDASKQLTNFTRLVSTSRIVEEEPGVFYFELQGTAFLWHQVRHMIAVLFLVGQRLESPDIVKEMLNINIFKTKPAYEMSDDKPLVLWDCDFPGIQWIYGDGLPGRDKTMDTVFTLWQRAKIEEVLTRGLSSLVQRNKVVRDTDDDANTTKPKRKHLKSEKEQSHYLITGDGEVTSRGRYVKVGDRERQRTVEEINKAYAERKGDWDTRRDARIAKRRKQAEDNGLEVPVWEPKRPDIKDQVPDIKDQVPDTGEEKSIETKDSPMSGM